MYIKLHRPVIVEVGDETIVLRVICRCKDESEKYIITVDVINHKNDTWKTFDKIANIKEIKKVLNTRKKITIEE